jgi:hypothetical protein
LGVDAFHESRGDRECRREDRAGRKGSRDYGIVRGRGHRVAPAVAGGPGRGVPIGRHAEEGRSGRRHRPTPQPDGLAGGRATVTTDRLLVRPRATTRYHQLNGRLQKGEAVRVVAQKETEEGLWYKVVVPRRFPLYAHVSFLRNAGPAALAEPKKSTKDISTAAKLAATDWDKHYLAIEKAVYVELPKVRAYDDAKQLRLQIMEVKPATLSAENRERRIVLLSKIVTRERELASREIKVREKSIGDELDRKLKEIEQRYREKLWRLRQEQKEAARKKPSYVAVGTVDYVPHLLGRHPSHRLTIEGKLKFYLVAKDYDLDRFIGKRVGVVGLTDRESGTGLQTVLIKRIEVLAEPAK